MFCQIVGVVIIVIAIVALVVQTFRCKIGTGNILALGFVAILGGVAISNLANIRELQMSSAGMSAKIEHIDSSVSQASDIEGRVKALADKIKQTQQDVNDSEHRISQSQTRISDLVREADEAKRRTSKISAEVASTLNETKRIKNSVSTVYASQQQGLRSFVDCTLLLEGTRNIFPIPTEAATELDKHLSILSSLAWPNVSEGKHELDRVTNLVRTIQKRTFPAQSK
jgi:hypothetical protein